GVLERGEIPFIQAADYFEFSYANWWVNRVIDQTPVLSQFVSADHERKIYEFREADSQFEALTRQYIQAKLAGNIPSTTMAPQGTPLGTLRRELQKKSRHMPVRKLMS